MYHASQQTVSADGLQHNSQHRKMRGIKTAICAHSIWPDLCIWSRGFSGTCSRASLTSFRGCDRMLGIKGSADHSRWTRVDRPSCCVDKKSHNNAPHRKCLRKRRLPASACLFSLESGMALEDDTSTISQTPTTHYTNTSERR